MRDATPKGFDPIVVAKEKFQRDVARHEMEVLHDEGLYRHLRFAEPGRNAYWFEVVTWPGALAVRGDNGGGYVFHRVEDMFAFFRRNGNEHGINPGYWAQKLETRIADTVREFSEELLVEWVADRIEEYATEVYPARQVEFLGKREKLDREHDHEAVTFKCPAKGCVWPRPEAVARLRQQQPKPPADPDGLRATLAAAVESGETQTRDDAWTLLRELERAGVCRDTWQVSFDTYSGEYLWFCHAIVWAIAAYDRGHTVPARREEEPDAPGHLETLQVAAGHL